MPAPNGAGRGPDGRFAAGNQAAKTHGLRSASRAELRKRNRRVSLRLAAYLRLRAEQGRAIRSTQLPLARRFCELEVLATDRFALVTSAPDNARALDEYLSITRALVAVADKLGEAAGAVSIFERDRPALLAAAAQERLRAKMATPQSPAAANGHAGRLAASEVVE